MYLHIRMADGSVITDIYDYTGPIPRVGEGFDLPYHSEAVLTGTVTVQAVEYSLLALGEGARPEYGMVMSDDPVITLTVE